MRDPNSILVMLASDARLSVHRRLSTTVSSKDKYFLGRDGGWWLNVGRGAVGLTVGCGAVSASFISGCFLLLYPALEETATLRLRLLQTNKVLLSGLASRDNIWSKNSVNKMSIYKHLRRELCLKNGNLIKTDKFLPILSTNLFYHNMSGSVYWYFSQLAPALGIFFRAKKIELLFT